MATIGKLALGLTVIPFVYGQVTYIVADGNPGGTDGSLIQISGTSFHVIAKGLGCPTDVALDPAGDYLVTDPCSDPVRILKVTPSGDVSTVFAGPPLENPIALVAEPSGTIVVADNSNDSLFRISPDGRSIQSLVKLPVCDPDEWQDMRMALTASGEVLVTDDECFSLKIFRITVEGTIAETITPTEVLSGSGIRLEPSGNMLIADYRQNTIFRVTPAGDVAAKVAQGICCNLVGLDADPVSGDLISAVNFESEILKVDTDGVISTVAKGDPLTYPNAVVIQRPRPDESSGTSRLRKK